MNIGGIEAVFDQLDRWQLLPNYQLERRADIFFSLYLPKFLESTLHVELQPMLIPEFPLHLRTIQHSWANNQSVKVDYVAVSKDLNRVLLIELKTNEPSIRQKQCDYLELAKEKTFRELVCGVLRIFEATKAKRTYRQLLFLLKDLRLITFADSAKANEELPGLSDKCVSSLGCHPEVIYLSPKGTKGIGFEQFGRWLRAHYNDPLSIRFARSLDTWSEPA